MKPLTLSIVIPVFNESHHIEGCLKAIEEQTETPEEVIVVDNNCTDDTIEKALKFKFVRVVKETTQGRTAARNRGFNSAKSEIIGRIDADAVIENDWIATVRKDFQDDSLSAVTGVAKTHTISETRGVYTSLWATSYLLAINSYFRVPILWGANMAIRRSAWDKIKKDVCLNDKLVHEDQDLSILLAGQRLKVVQDHKLIIKSTEWSYHRLPKLNEYLKRSWTTKKFRKDILNRAEVKKFTAAYSIGVYALLLIPGLIFYISSIIYFVFGPIFLPVTKKN